ncbi:MAG: 50S ribosomal protein L11 methyltransferase [candidate division NC10 bacterium]|nr:50S ribosomal protein L11 methyltransferase [candidate division NC10 bacterium]
MIQVGSRLRVSSYSGPAVSADDILILVRPSPAFGDGHHPTTQMCLEMVECEIRRGERVLDLGTGTGILAIAAAKLGAEKVIAADIDWQACEAALANIHWNRVEKTVHVFQGSVEALHPDRPFDVAVTNLYNAHQVKAVIPAIARRIVIGGRIICSGIWRHRAEEMVRLLADQRLAYRNQMVLENLITISAVKEA